MAKSDLSGALRAWSGLLGTERVSSDPAVSARYEANVTAIERRIPATLYPLCTEDVVGVVRVANEYRVPIFPIGRGLNWGLGSRLPVRDDCVLVDLSRMDRIHEVSVTGQYAVVEPGVSQRQMADHLVAHDLPLVLNVNGSGAGTSVIGNALERGIGYFSSRADALSGLEIVLGTGEVLRTGFGHYADCSITHVYRHGHGPFLDGLFSQGNFGIVTRAGVDLLPRQEVYRAAVVRIVKDGDLEALVAALAWLRSRELVQGVIHLGNWHRAASWWGPSPGGTWNSGGSRVRGMRRSRTSCGWKGTGPGAQ